MEKTNHVNEQVKKAVADLSQLLAPVVTEIENSPATTQNHYGNYMSVISQASGGDKKKAQLIALALMKAGGNKAGINSAMQFI